MRFNHPDDIIALTPEWKGERFPDGRPKVPDHYLDAIRSMTLEELWTGDEVPASGVQGKRRAQL